VTPREAGERRCEGGKAYLKQYIDRASRNPPHRMS
jgi:hypothetical protein